MKLIPPHMYGPPERCYFTQVTEHLGITAYAYGKGMGVYIPWPAGKLFYDEGYSQPGNVMKDVLFNLCGVKSEAVSINPMVEMTISKKPGKTLVQFANVSGHFGASYFAPIPLYNQTFALKLKKAPKEVKTLKEDNNAVHFYKDGVLTVTVKKLTEYEGVVISEE